MGHNPVVSVSPNESKFRDSGHKPETLRLPRTHPPVPELLGTDGEVTSHASSAHR